MEFEYSKTQIKFERELSNLDKLVLRFTSILDRQKIKYAIISGYVAILFGRSRETEDIDLFIEEIPFEKFEQLWKELYNDIFECINAPDAKEAYFEYLKNQTAIRFARRGTFIWNFEIKFPKTKYNKYSLNHQVEVLLNNNKIMTSEMELQIAFKLSLGSDKDFEDARHLYNIFKEHLDTDLLKNQISELGVQKRAEKVLWKKA
ncbi:MAG: hypothetical protein Q7K34_01150 [archaeon]|nr:hypothetical protein [archaeon]